MFKAVKLGQFTGVVWEYDFMHYLRGYSVEKPEMKKLNNSGFSIIVCLTSPSLFVIFADELVLYITDTTDFFLPTDTTDFSLPYSNNWH